MQPVFNLMWWHNSITCCNLTPLNIMRTLWCVCASAALQWSRCVFIGQISYFIKWTVRTAVLSLINLDLGFVLGFFGWIVLVLSKHFLKCHPCGIWCRNKMACDCIKYRKGSSVSQNRLPAVTLNLPCKDSCQDLEWFPQLNLHRGCGCWRSPVVSLHRRWNSPSTIHLDL